MLRNHAWLPLLAGALAFLLAPLGGLVWDDQVVATQQIQAFKSLADILQPPPDIPQWSYAYYRPAVVLTYLLDVQLFGPGSAIGPHAMNVIYHLLTTLSVWWLARRVLGCGDPGSTADCRLGALAAATLFAVHPLHTESVSWITGRSDLLATLFLVPALHLSLRFRDEGALWQMLLSPVLFLLALLAKEVAIAGLALLPLVWLATPADPPARRSDRSFARLATAGSWLGAAGVWWSLRLSGTAAVPFAPGGLDALVLNPLRAVAWYLQKLLWPLGQSNFVVWELLPTLGSSLAVIAVAGLALLWSARLWRQGATRVPLLGIAWTGLTLVPSLLATQSGIAETPVAERYLYLPSVGFALALGAMLAWLLTAMGNRSPRARPALLGVTALLSVTWLALCINRGLVWQDNARLWADASRKAPGHALPLIEWGRAQLIAGEESAALDSFQRARALAGSFALRAVAYYNEGLIYAQRGQLPLAEQSFQAAVEVNPSYSQAYYGLGRVTLDLALAPGSAPPEERQAGLRRAEENLRQATRISPGFGDAWVQLAQLRGTLGDAPGALAALVRGAAGEPAILARPEVAGLIRILCHDLGSGEECAALQRGLAEWEFVGD